MLDEFEVRDLPETSSEVVSETTSLREVAAAVRHGDLEMVVVTEGQRVRGLVRADAVLRMAGRIPDAPVGMLPTQLAVTVKQTMNLVDAMRAVSTPDVGGLAVEHHGTWTVVTRDQLVGLTSWDALIARREKRISGVRAP